MNKIDEYWFWVNRAILESDLSRKYYYDKSSDSLFGISIEGATLLPMFRNKVTELNEKTKLLFEKEIFKVTNNDPEIILLPRLRFEEKKKFLYEFAWTIPDEEIYKEIRENFLKKVKEFSEKSNFDFVGEIKREQKALYYQYELAMIQFIEKKVAELFKPLGISDLSIVIW